MRLASSKSLITAFALYIVIALAQTWPLPLHLSTRLTGSPGGDTGVYVWNTWIFGHELLGKHRSPFRTTSILPLDGPTDLSLHNYTVFADLLALPLQPYLGVVATFNVVYVFNTALAGFGMFLLARRFTGQDAEAWIAGLLFACSPFLVSRGMEHFSLAAAAPLPLFVYWLDRAWATTRMRDSMAAGIVLAWAAFSDPYYAIYCVLLALVYTGSRVLRVTRRQPVAGQRHWLVLIDVVLATLISVIAGLHLLFGGQVRMGSVAVSMRSLYTPVLLVSSLVLLRLVLMFRPAVTWWWPAQPIRFLRMATVAGLSAAVLLAPELYAIALRAAEGRMVTAPVFWRSSAPGLDLVAFLLPNPNHPLAPHWIAAWLERQPGHYVENVASLPWVAIAVIAFAWRRAGFSPAKVWVFVTLGFASLALGPFVHVAGVLTYIPTPWTLLRYVPVIGEARMPPRFAVLVTLGLSMLFAGALVAIGRRYPARRRIALWSIGLALGFELLPAPRQLFSAEVPAVYQIIAADPRPIRILELPFGIRDGLSSLGNFTAASQFYQTLHGKALIGGYLSRVSTASKQFHRGQPLLSALMDLSEGRSPSAAERSRALVAARTFPQRAHLGYVVMSDSGVTPDLRQFAIEALHLRLVATSSGHELYVPEVE